MENKIKSGSTFQPVQQFLTFIIAIIRPPVCTQFRMRENYVITILMLINESFVNMKRGNCNKL